MLQRRSGRVIASFFADRNRRCFLVAPATSTAIGGILSSTSTGRLLLRRRREHVVESWRCFVTNSDSAIGASASSASSSSSASDIDANNIEHESNNNGGDAHIGTLPYQDDDAIIAEGTIKPFIKNEKGKTTKAKNYGGRNITSYQNSLLEYTQSLLTVSPSPQSTSTSTAGKSSVPSSSSTEYGTLSNTKIMEISHCIEQWMSSREHGHLGGDQALLLLQRLIFERMIVMGRRRCRQQHQVQDHALLRQQQQQLQQPMIDSITWEMLHIPLVIQYLNELYTGQDFVDNMMSIVAMFEEGEAMSLEQERDDGGDTIDEEGMGWEESGVPYKSIIALLCDARTPDTVTAAELILHRFESRLILEDNDDNNYYYKHANPPTTETYNRIISCWYSLSRGEGIATVASLGGGVIGRDHHIVVRRPVVSSSWPYNYHPNPCSNLLSHMIQLYNSNRNAMARLKPDGLSFNITISSLSKDQQVEVSSRGGNWGEVCYEHLMTMLDYYNSGDIKCAPDLITFSTVLHALARGNNKGDDVRAREVLDIMLYLSGAVDPPHNITPSSSRMYEFDILPRNRHFNLVLALMAKRCGGGQDRGKVEWASSVDDALEVATRYVGIMEKLKQNEEKDMNSGMLAEYGDKYYDYMEANTDDGLYTAYTNDWDKIDEQTRISMTTSAPDIVTYNTLLSIAAKLGRPKVAEEMLESMIQRSSSGKSQVKPDTFSFNTVCGYSYVSASLFIHSQLSGMYHIIATGAVGMVQI